MIESLPSPTQTSNSPQKASELSYATLDALIQRATGDTKHTVTSTARLTRMLTADKSLSPQFVHDVTTYMRMPIKPYGRDNLPRSMRPFTLYHPGLDRTRKVPHFIDSFKKQLASEETAESFLKRIDTYSAEGGIQVGDLLWHTGNNMNHWFTSSMDAYRNVTRKDLAIYRSAIKELDKLPHMERSPLLAKPIYVGFHETLLGVLAEPVVFDYRNTTRNEVYYGRDAVGAYAARKAHAFGSRPDLQIVYFPLSRPASEDINLAEYLAQYVDETFYHIDTGFNRTVPRRALEKMGVTTPDEQNKRIKLLSSNTPSIQHLYEGSLSIREIESRPQAILETREIIETDGRWVIKQIPSKEENRLGAWTVRQAIVRALLPRFTQK